MILVENESTVLNAKKFFKARGMTDMGISGLLGNWYSESGVRTNNLQNGYNTKFGMTDEEFTKAVDNNTFDFLRTDVSFGYGLAQWTSIGRRTGLWNLAKATGTSIADEQTQFEWAWEELNSRGYMAVLNVLMDPAATVADCAEIVVTKYEKPASVLNESTKQATIDKRINYAEEFYRKYFLAVDDTKKNESAEVEVDIEILPCILTKNDCYKTNKKITPTGIVVHSTGANNKTLRRYVQPDDGILGVNQYNNSWNAPGINKCVNAFIGEDKNGRVRIYQTLPWDTRPWGCGSGSKGSYNNSHIQFEICEDALTDVNYFNAVMDKATSLCAYLCKKFGISLANVVSHNEAYKQGYASGHADIDHWLKKFGKDMNWFRTLVADKMNTTTHTNTNTDFTNSTNSNIQKEKEETTSSTSYKVKVSEVTVVYKDTNEVAPVGVYTITETRNGMGKLKSGIGWIPLANAKKV